MRAAAAAGLCTLLLAVACGPNTAGGEGNNTSPQRGGSLKVGLEYEPRTLDPLYADSVDELQVLRQMFEPLVEVDARFNLRPLLATSWSFSDPTTLVLRLRRGVRFQNGEPFTSSAVRYTLDREIGSASPRAQEVAGVESVATPSPDVAVLRLRRADPALLYRLAGPAGMMVSQVAVAAQGSAAEFGRNPVVAGTGPFAFQFWRRGYHLILKRNPRYWGPAPYLDQLDFTQVSPKPALPRLEASDLDVVERLDPAGVSQAEQDANLVTGSRTGFVYSGLLLNQAPGAVFTNPARRQVVASIAPLGAALLTPRSWAYDPTLRPPPRPAAGPGFSFTLKVDTEPEHLDDAVRLRSALAARGVRMLIQSEDPDAIRTDLEGHTFDAAMVQLGGSPDPDGDLYPQFHTGGPDNFGQFSDPRVDADLDAARAAAGRDRRRPLYLDAQRRLAADAAFVLTGYPPVLKAIGRWVHGLRFRADGTFDLSRTWLG